MGKIFDCVIGEVFHEIFNFVLGSVRVEKVVGCWLVNYSLDSVDENEGWKGVLSKFM